MRLEESPVKLVGTRHEQGATFMADAYGRMTGRPGVAMLTAGPGFSSPGTVRSAVVRPDRDWRAFRRLAVQGITSACFGLMLATIGTDTIAGDTRFTFSLSYFEDRPSIIPMIIGLFGSRGPFS